MSEESQSAESKKQSMWVDRVGHYVSAGDTCFVFQGRQARGDEPSSSDGATARLHIRSADCYSAVVPVLALVQPGDFMTLWFEKQVDGFICTQAEVI